MGPIGVFDSGYGGLTILKEIREQLPQYDYLYLGDNARAPYGTRSYDVVFEYTLQAVHELFDRGCELVILACNTASAKALRSIQQKELPKIDTEKRVLGVLRPTTEIISQYSNTKQVGILATKGTVSSDSYRIEIDHFSPECGVYQRACPMWVPLIENNLQDTEGGKIFVQQDVQALLAENSEIDTLLLACTHFPILKDFIQSIVPSHVKVLSQGGIVAASLKDYLKRHAWMDTKCSKDGQVEFLTTESKVEFDLNATQYFGAPVDSTHITLK